MGAMNHRGTDLSMPGISCSLRESVPLAQAAAFKRDNWSPCDPLGGHFRDFDGGFRQLLGNSEQMFAPFHLAPHVVGPHPGRGPQNREIVEQIGALAHYRGGIAADGIDHDLDGLFGQFLGHLGRAALKQPGGSRNRRIEILGRHHRAIKPFERITHGPKLTETYGQRVNAPVLVSSRQKAGRKLRPACLLTSIRDGMATEIRPASVAVTPATEIAWRSTVIDGPTAVIDRPTAIIGRTAIVVVVAIPGCSDRKPGANDAGKRGRRSSTSAATVIMAAPGGAEVRSAAGSGRHARAC